MPCATGRRPAAHRGRRGGSRGGCYRQSPTPPRSGRGGTGAGFVLHRLAHDPAAIPPVDVARRESAEQPLAVQDERLAASGHPFERSIEGEIRLAPFASAPAASSPLRPPGGIAPLRASRPSRRTRSRPRVRTRRRPGTPSNDPRGDASRGRGAAWRRPGSAAGAGPSPRRPVRRTGLGARGLLAHLEALADHHPADEGEEEPVAVPRSAGAAIPTSPSDGADDDPSPSRDPQGDETVLRDPPDHREQHPPAVEGESRERVQSGEEQAEDRQVLRGSPRAPRRLPRHRARRHRRGPAC